jgi:hypothetical protein
MVRFQHSIYFNEQTDLALLGYGKCGSAQRASDSEMRQFESINSLVVDWKSENQGLLKLEPKTVKKDEGKCNRSLSLHSLLNKGWRLSQF